MGPATAGAADAPFEASSSGSPVTVTGDGAPAGQVVLQAVSCNEWSDVPANATPDAPRDDTDGRYAHWGPFDGQTVAPVAADHLADCRPLDGVSFRLSGTEYGNGLANPTTPTGAPIYPQEATSTASGRTGDSGPGTLGVAAASLTELQRQAMVDGKGLWVEAIGFSGQFANLRCHEDRFNADNLEVIRMDAGAPPAAACVLYVIGGAAVQSAPPQGVQPTPPITAAPTVATPPSAATPIATPGTNTPVAVDDEYSSPVQPEPATVIPGPASDTTADAAPPIDLRPEPVVPTGGGQLVVPSPPLVVDDRVGVLDERATAPTTTALVVEELTPQLPGTTSTTARGSADDETAITVMSTPILLEEPAETTEEARAAAAAAAARSGLGAVPAAGLTALFLAGLGLSVLAARRPL